MCSFLRRRREDQIEEFQFFISHSCGNNRSEVSGSAGWALIRCAVTATEICAACSGVFSVLCSVWEGTGAWGDVRAQEEQIWMFPEEILGMGALMAVQRATVSGRGEVQVRRIYPGTRVSVPAVFAYFSATLLYWHPGNPEKPLCGCKGKKSIWASALLETKLALTRKCADWDFHSERAYNTG